jgi:ABC-type anion transport system duplicated permease subunit
MPVLRRRAPLVLFTLAFPALVLFPVITTLLTGWWWFREIG